MKVRLQRNRRRPLGKGFPRSVYGSHGLNHALYYGFTLNLGGSEMRHTRIGKDLRLSLGGEHKEGAMHDTIRGQIQAMIKGQSAIIRG